jgi:ribonuclease MRP protein subunit RMP1
MPPKPPLDPTQLKLLHDDLDLLHLLFHRNKNQHRLLKWWQWIATLRRNLNKLLAEHDLITKAKTTPDRNAAVTKYKERVTFMRRVVVPSAYNAFGIVIGMNAFAPLGMVLMGVLARVWKAIKPTEEELEAERELAAIAMKLEAVNANAELGVVVPRGYDGGDGDEEGVIISRAEYEGMVSIQAGKTAGTEETRIHRVEDRREASPKDALQPSAKKHSTRSTKPKRQKSHSIEPSTESAKQTPKGRIGTPQADPESTSKNSKRKLDTEPEKRKKKKKKRGDDIDDLFSGLF